MSRSELKAWLSLAALVAVFWWFQMRMLDGGMIVDQSPGRLLWVYFVVIGAATLLEILISSAVAVAGGGRAVERDERDLAIDARANQIERFVVIAAVNVLIWQALWEGVMPGRAPYSIDPTHLPTLIFLLFAVLFIGEGAKRISTIILYRLQSPKG